MVFRFGWFMIYMIWQVIVGASLDFAATLKPRHKIYPAIVEIPLRCRSDLEIALFAWAITIPPGTAVISIAAGDGKHPATFFVHSLHIDNEPEIRDSLWDLESRLLRAVRKDFTP